MYAEQHSVNSSWKHVPWHTKQEALYTTTGHPVCCKLDRLDSNMLAGLHAFAAAMP